MDAWLLPSASSQRTVRLRVIFFLSTFNSRLSTSSLATSNSPLLLLSFSRVLQAPPTRLRARPLRSRRQDPHAPRPLCLRNEASPRPPHRRRKTHQDRHRPPPTKWLHRRCSLCETVCPPADRDTAARQIPDRAGLARTRRP